MTEDMEIKEFLRITEAKNASDLHLVAGYPPSIRVDGELIPLPNYPRLTNTDTEKLILPIINEQQRGVFKANKELDFSITTESAHFRVNLYYQHNSIAAAFRFIPQKIRSIEELGLPQVLYSFTKMHQGFILVTGPTGHGKSTTQAALINEINKKRAVHIVTIEDPIEYVYPKEKAIISQRELHSDTYSWNMALRAVLREDPNVVLIGEMRDLETIQSAITIAETGHLVFATLHTNSAAQSIERIIDVFPAHQQSQIRTQLSEIFQGIISQRLVPAIGGGRVVASELLMASPAVKTGIREGKTHQMDNIIQTSSDFGMNLLESSLGKLVSEGKISVQTAQEYALRPSEIMRQITKSGTRK